MRHFCTYFDRNYLLHGLTMYRSLRAHSEPFRLHVLCLDDATHDFLSALGHDELQPIALEDFERGDEALAQAKQNRSRVEYSHVFGRMRARSGAGVRTGNSCRHGPRQRR